MKTNKQEKAIVPEGSNPIKTEFELNNNSNKYTWNESFVQKIADKIFSWFNSDETLWFYSDFPRTDLKMTFNQFIRKMAEYPLIWEDVHNELKLITTTRLAYAMLKNKVSVPGAIQALKHMGERWNDKTEINLNVKSIGELIEEAYGQSEATLEADKQASKSSKKQVWTAPKPLTEEEKRELFEDLDSPPSS